MVRWVLGFVVGLFAATAAHADSWMMPTRHTFMSANGAVRLTVEPGQLRSQFAYYDDKVKNREPAGRRAGETRHTAQATLERSVGGRWTAVWRGPLANEVAPVSALVGNDGAHVVTFDNWGSTGYGDNVVVLYGADGRLVRALRLDQILPADYVEALPRSVSSLQWSGDHRLSPDGRRLLVAVVIPDDSEPFTRNRPTVEIAVDLDTGTVTPPSGPAWDHALAQAKRVAAAREASEAARRAAFVAPLLAPQMTGEREWHQYMLEAFFRLDPHWKRDYPNTTVLRSPTVPDYKPSEKWVREALDGSDRSDVVMLAAPTAPDQLVTIVADVVRRLPTGKLKGVRIYLAVPPQPAQAITAALRPSGAEIVTLGLTKPIPQRPERLRGETPADDLMDLADELDTAADAVASPRP